MALQLQLRLTLPGANAPSLALPANWTANRTGITAVTPGEQQPLAAGGYTVQASLNGGADWTGGPDQEPMVSADPQSRSSSIQNTSGFEVLVHVAELLLNRGRD